MKRRTRTRVIIWGITALLAVMVVGIPVLKLFYFKHLIKRSISRATGLPCSIDALWRTDRKLFFRGLKLGPPTRPLLVIDRGMAATDIWPARDADYGSIIGTDLTIQLTGLPPVTVRECALNLDSLHNPDTLTVQVMAEADCTALNALTSKQGKVKFERGTLEIFFRTEVPKKERVLNLSVPITLKNFLVRSLDGKFEVSGGRVTVTVNVSGTLKEPKLDLGGLEPYLGREFVESFRESAP